MKLSSEIYLELTLIEKNTLYGTDGEVQFCYNKYKVAHHDVIVTISSKAGVTNVTGCFSGSIIDMSKLVELDKQLCMVLMDGK